MLTQICLCLLLITMTYTTVNAKPVSSKELDTQHNKLSDALMLEQLGIAANRQYDEDNSDEDEFIHEKRQFNKKRARFYQGAHSPYTIAFPALIRSRRWIA